MTVKPDIAINPKKPINRREFLTLALLASLGILTLDIAGVTYMFAMPRFKAGEFGGIVPLGTVADMPTAGSAPVNMPGIKIWLSNTEQGAYSLYKVCTHLGCLYNWNTQEFKFICPCHGSQFQANGTYIRGPAPRNLDRFVMQALDPATGKVLAETKGNNPMPLPNDPKVLIQVNTGDLIRGTPHG